MGATQADRCGVVFFKAKAPVEPVSLVHQICVDAMQRKDTKKTRWTRRLTPVTMMGKATVKGLEGVSKAVLAPYFHSEEITAKKVRHSLFLHILHFISLTLSALQTVAGLLGFHPHLTDIGAEERPLPATCSG